RSQVRCELGGLRFPDSVRTSNVDYDAPIKFEALEPLLERLTFPGRAHAADLLRHALLKRIDSSLHAARVSLRRQINFVEACENAAKNGRALDVRAYRSLYVEDDDVLQLAFDGLVESKALDPDAADMFALELNVLRRLRRSLARDDVKLDALTQLLQSRRDQKTVVFTEYRDTARYLWRNLRRRFRAGLIDGEG